MKLATEFRRRRTPIPTSPLNKSPPPPPNPNQKKPKVIVISGTTASGKSRLALALAKRLDGEIISADSVQIYRGLNIGSAKPSPSDQSAVPHHLIDILEPSEDYSAGLFFYHARTATDKVLRNGKVPLVVGGTGLYLRWFIYGKPEVPTAAVNVSPELLSFQAEGRWGEAVEAVEAVVNAGDPRARDLAANDWYRLRRRLEIIRSSGSPPSAFTVPYDSYKEEFDSIGKDLDLEYDFVFLFLTCRRVDLYRAIDLRCERMVSDVEGGILYEASWLLDIGLRPETNSATRAIGYRQAMEYLLECRRDGGGFTADCFFKFLDEFQKASRNFAKRQLTWFRNESLYQWIDSSMPLEDLVEFVCSAYDDQDEKLLVPNHLQMKRTANDKAESYELKTYRTQNQIFRNESDCRHVLDWVERTQRRKLCSEDDRYP